MTPLELLRRLYVAGVDVGLNDAGGMRLRGHQPPPELVDALKANRDAVVSLLRAHSIGRADDGLESTVPRRYVTPAGCLAPRACTRLGPCSRFLTRKPCDRAERTQTESEAA
jgi:hypothetical protein